MNDIDDPDYDPVTVPKRSWVRGILWAAASLVILVLGLCAADAYYASADAPDAAPQGPSTTPPRQLDGPPPPAPIIE